jgi:hypothetical protein
MKMKHGNIYAAAAALMLPLLAAASDTQHCYLRDAAPPAASAACLLCEQGLVYSTSDTGATWAALDAGAAGNLHAASFFDATHGILVGETGALLATAVGGNCWQTIKTDAAQWSPAAVRFFDANNGRIAGFSGQLPQPTDGGTTWKAKKSPTQSWLTSIATDRAKRLWVAADDYVPVSEDGGRNWKAVPVPSSFFAARLFPVGDSLYGLAALGIGRQTSPGFEWKHEEAIVPADAHICNSVSETLGKSKELEAT